ncbi:MAG: DNA double-strand break repair nuclease NurA [Chloroflexi bacterium]|nr:DNA double-strand break repair nuclease NurA [Chloroflexota bacterium]
MPIDSLGVSTQVRQMGGLLVSRRAEHDRRSDLARGIVRRATDAWEELAATAEKARERVAVPTGPLDASMPVTLPPRAYTAIATDGSEVDPDRHGAYGDFFLVNLGWARIPYGQPGRDADLRSQSHLGYEEKDLFIVDPSNPKRQVPMRDRHLDALRTVREIEALADLAEAEAGQHGDVPIVALVDGTLLFSVLEERPKDFLRGYFYGQYVTHLDRLRSAGVILAAYASRSRGIDVVNLFRSQCGVEPSTCSTCSVEAGVGPHRQKVCCLRGLTDSNLLADPLEQWERSALFRVRSNVHDPYFGPHRVFFFLLETGQEVARVEIPEWVARDSAAVQALHTILVDQCVKGQGYPAVLARADDRAVIRGEDRALLDALVRQELARRGIVARASAKLNRKHVRTV